MSEAFVAFVRFEEKLLLLKRSEQSEYFSGLWDGVWGVGATPEEVLERVASSTGIPVESLHYHGSGPERGIDMGRSLVDVIPVLVVADTDAVEPAGIYTHAEWIDPGNIKEFKCIFSDIDMENADGPSSRTLTWKTQTACSVKCTVVSEPSSTSSRQPLTPSNVSQMRCTLVFTAAVQ